MAVGHTEKNACACLGEMQVSFHLGSASPRVGPRAVTEKDLVSQLVIYAVSLSDRISRYEREEVGSTPALRAIYLGE